MRFNSKEGFLNKNKRVLCKLCNFKSSVYFFYFCLYIKSYEFISKNHPVSMREIYIFDFKFFRIFKQFLKFRKF